MLRSLWPLASDTLHYESNQGQRPGLPLQLSVPDLAGGRFALGYWDILGGVWANYSWGKILGLGSEGDLGARHAARLFVRLTWTHCWKWAGFGMAVGAVLGFQGRWPVRREFWTGVGLHSYGFGTGGFGWALLFFVAAEIGFVLVAVSRKARVASRPSHMLASSRPQPVR